MAQQSARKIALTALSQWRGGRQFADAVLEQLLANAPLSSPDRGFAIELFYGTLRNLMLLDFWLGRLRAGSLDPDTRELLRLGIYQLFFLETAEHAAVYETVELAPIKARGLVNGVLRTAVRKRAELRKHAEAQPLEVRKSHPRFLIQRWSEKLGPHATSELCDWNNRPAPLYARINRLKTSDEAFLRGHTRSDAIPDYPGFARMGALPRDALLRGDCYMQDPSTSMACGLLDPQPGERVLDACAAPGGKTALLAEQMQNRGSIVACDRDAARSEMLRANLARLGVTMATIVCHDWTKGVIPLPEAGAAFDRILVDAPCSNTGVIRRRVDLRWRLKESDFLQMQHLQLTITAAVVPLLKPGGAIVYSTCSLEPEENEQARDWICGHFPFLILEAEKTLLPFRDQVDGAFAVRFRRQD
ncbi:MAG: 16S rRNA (cytosine(967)-C(5))-methyltransferase RsmB [Chthoniobacterales bacterium]